MFAGVRLLGCVLATMQLRTSRARHVLALWVSIRARRVRISGYELTLDQSCVLGMGALSAASSLKPVLAAVVMDTEKHRSHDIRFVHLFFARV